jgi:hypothetical protein
LLGRARGIVCLFLILKGRKTRKGKGGYEKVILVRFEDFMAVTMKNAVFCDKRTQFIPNMRHITYPLQSLAG